MNRTLKQTMTIYFKIMLGVHGNGLTSLAWMRPTPRSTVIEFYWPTGFMFDYEYTTRALGMVHYGVWNNM